MSISVQQYGQTLVVTGSSAGFFFPKLITLLTILTNMKITTAIIKKFIIAVINEPYLRLTPPIDKTMLEKSRPPNKPSIGEIMSFVSESTMVLNAPPIITPSA